MNKDTVDKALIYVFTIGAINLFCIALWLFFYLGASLIDWDFHIYQWRDARAAFIIPDFILMLIFTGYFCFYHDEL